MSRRSVASYSCSLKRTERRRSVGRSVGRVARERLLRCLACQNLIRAARLGITDHRAQPCKSATALLFSVRAPIGRSGAGAGVHHVPSQRCHKARCNPTISAALRNGENSGERETHAAERGHPRPLQPRKMSRAVARRVPGVRCTNQSARRPQARCRS